MMPSLRKKPPDWQLPDQVSKARFAPGFFMDPHHDMVMRNGCLADKSKCRRLA
jgi:hypothetical protein